MTGVIIVPDSPFNSPVSIDPIKGWACTGHKDFCLYSHLSVATDLKSIHYPGAWMDYFVASVNWSSNWITVSGQKGRLMLQEK